MNWFFSHIFRKWNKLKSRQKCVIFQRIIEYEKTTFRQWHGAIKRYKWLFLCNLSTLFFLIQFNFEFFALQIYAFMSITFFYPYDFVLHLFHLGNSRVWLYINRMIVFSLSLSLFILRKATRHCIKLSMMNTPET